MCQECAELSAKIEHYGTMKRAVTDAAALSAMDALIVEYQARQKSLHPAEQAATERSAD